MRQATAGNGVLSDRRRLVLLSFLMLFVELALIRWTGSNVLYLSYFSNFVLMGSFLGIGIGFLRAKSPHDLFAHGTLLLALLIGFVLMFPVVVDRASSDLIFFGSGVLRGLPIWLVLPTIFLAVAIVMASIAQEVARTFARFAPLEAYRLDILGSLCGVVAFSALSFLGAPPVVWGIVVVATFLILQYPSLTLLQVAASVAIVIMLGKESIDPRFSWSPYYKISIFEVLPGRIAVNVNGIPHQWITSTAVVRQATPIYTYPYRRLVNNPLDDVLVIGAGDGVDTALALEAGAKHVDAVEIDPRIYRLGKTLNPNHPYDDPRVTVHIDDGRAFLQRSRNSYDLILFALPDSLTLVAGQSSLRLESYLFTLESMRTARAHLRPGGVFAMYNAYREVWLIDRLAATLNAVYGYPPCVDGLGTAGQFALLTVGLVPANVRCADVWGAHEASVPAPVPDDRPFLYLAKRSIPTLYLVALGLILLLSVALVRLNSGPLTNLRSYVDLFFMGAAFLLLETKSVVQFALLFGSTWFVNALVFFGILVAVLAAVEVARRVRPRHPGILYAALFVSLALAWAIEPARLLELDAPLRLAAAIALAFTPVFLANLIFADRFRAVASSTDAFAANLLGAMTGGVLEYAALIVGYRALLIFVALLYGFAFLFSGAMQARDSRAESEPVAAS